MATKVAPSVASFGTTLVVIRRINKFEAITGLTNYVLQKLILYTYPSNRPWWEIMVNLRKNECLLIQLLANNNEAGAIFRCTGRGIPSVGNPPVLAEVPRFSTRIDG